MQTVKRDTFKEQKEIKNTAEKKPPIIHCFLKRIMGGFYVFVNLFSYISHDVWGRAMRFMPQEWISADFHGTRSTQLQDLFGFLYAIFLF